MKWNCTVKRGAYRYTYDGQGWWAIPEEGIPDTRYPIFFGEHLMTLIPEIEKELKTWKFS